MGGTIMPQYLDENGNPIQGKTYLDPNTGEPLSSSTTAETPQEGFWHSLGSQLGITPEAAEAARQHMLDHPLSTAAKLALGPAAPVVEGLYNQAKQSTGQLAQAIKDYRGGNSAQAGIDAIQAVPIVGPAMNKAAEQYGEDNRAGEMGTLAGATIQAAPLALGAADAAMPGRPIIPNPPIARTIGRAALLGRTPEEAYESALKPSTTIPQTQRSSIVQSGLQNEIPVSKAGVEKINELIDDLNQKIESQISAAGPNRTINPASAVQNLKDVRAKFSNQVNPTADVQAIDNSGQEFLNQFRSQPGGAVRNMSASEAQSMKQGTYRVLAGKYGEQGSASVEAQKALARGLKEEIANQFPEINQLNAQESKLLDLQPVLERAVNRISNHQVIGIGTPVAGVAAETLTGSPGIGRVAMVMKGVLDNPTVKSRLAIAVSKANRIPYAQAMGRINDYSTALAASGAVSSSASPDQSGQPNTSQ